MGCSPGDKDCDKQAEKPVDVLISRDFSLGQTEVTQDAYQRVMKADPSFYKGALRPVHGVSWDEAKNYCASVGGRLPTEAEWEYAARAGSTGARYGNLDQIAWYFGNSNKYTHDVGGKLPNKWGLYDMLGNVWEWTADWYDPLLRGGTDPQGPPKEILKETVRVVRGGSWNNLPELVRASFRDRDAPVYRDSRIGFRCVRDLP